MDDLGEDIYDPVCTEDPEDRIENDDLSETIPPCKECEKHFFYRKSTFNCFDGLFVLISMVSFIADVVTDSLVTFQYFKTEPHPHYAWGSLTLAFTLGPSIVMQIFSASWYVADEDMTKWRWIMHLLQLAPLQRYIRVFKTGLTARESDDPLDFQRLHHQQSDVSMLRLFEAFLESAPQVVLQLYVMVATDDENIFTGISAMVSLFSLCWAMVAYSKNHRKVRSDKNIVSIPGLILQTIWRIGMISSRVVALVLFASIFQAKLFIVAAVHWFCMTIWVYLQNTDFCDSWVEERIFNGVIGVIYLFCFFNLKEGNSRYRVTFFYSIMFGENVILLTLWYLYKTSDSWYDPVAFGVVFGGFGVGVSSMLLYYRFFHPRGSGAILLYKKKTDDDRHRLHPKGHAPRNLVSEGAEICRRNRSPSPVKKHSPHCSPQKQCGGNSPLAYPIPSRSLTPCKYSPLRSDCELPYDRYGMRRRSPHRSQSEQCIDSFSSEVITPPRLARVHSDHVYTRRRSPRTPTPVKPSNFEFSGFATDLVKQFDKKMDRACASAIGNHSYGSYGFDVEAQMGHSHYDSNRKSEHHVMVHAASSSQPDVRRPLATVDENNQSSVLLEPLSDTIEDTPSKIKNAHEVKQMYNTMANDMRSHPNSKRQLVFGQSGRNPPVMQPRFPTPRCIYHQKIPAWKSKSLPTPRRQTPQKPLQQSRSLPRQQNMWHVCEIDISEPKNNLKKVQNENGLPKTPPKLEPPPQEKLKIPVDTSKIERQMLKPGEKRKFSFKEKVPEAKLKTMRFTPKPEGDGPNSPIWKLRALNAKLWQPKRVDIYNPNLNNSPGKLVVGQKPFGPQSADNFSFGSEDSPDMGNIYTIFGPPGRLKNVNSDIKSNKPIPSINVAPTPHNSLRGSTSNTRQNINSNASFEFSVKQNQFNSSNIRKKSPFNSTGRSENIYATIEENESENHDYSELASYIYGGNDSGDGSGGKKRKISPRADLPQQNLKASQPSSHPVTPLTPSKSYRLADRDLQNSPHRHISSSSSSNRTKSRLNFTQTQRTITESPTLFEEIKETPQIAAIKQKDSKLKLSTNLMESNLNSRIVNITSNPLNYLPGRISIQPPQLNLQTTLQEKDIFKMPDTRKASTLVPKSLESYTTNQPKLESKTENGPTHVTITISATSYSNDKPKKSTSDGRGSKKPTSERQSPRSNSLSAINDSINSNVSALISESDMKPKVESNSKDTAPRNDKSSSKKSTSSLEKLSGKSQSLPEIATANENSEVKKDTKPKAQSDNRENRDNFKQPLKTSSRKPLSQLQNGSIIASSNSEKHIVLDKSLICRKSKLSPTIENVLPLMQSTPALPDCRKLLKFESTGAKPKSRPFEMGLDVKDTEKTKTKTLLSPVVSRANENKNLSLISDSTKSKSEEVRITQPTPSIMESRLRERLGRYDVDIKRGKENQHLAIARIFEGLSPTDSFVSSLAFQNTIDNKKAPPKKPPRTTSLGKMPKLVPDNKCSQSQ